MSKTTNKFSPEVRARAVRMVLDHGGDRDGSVLRGGVIDFGQDWLCLGGTNRLLKSCH